MAIRYWILVFLLATMPGCNRPEETQASVELKRLPLDTMDGVRAASGVALDPVVSLDGHGSLRVDAAGQTVVPLFEVTDIQIENAALVYQASLQSEGLNGQAYLEMWVRIPGKGEFFSRGLDRQLTGTMSWATVATPFFLEAGQMPDLIRLNLVVNGTGKIWMDDIRLLRQPLR
jgi:hypothetical protein